MHYLIVNYTTEEAVEVEATNPESALTSPRLPDYFHLDEEDDVTVYLLGTNEADQPVKYHIDELVLE